MNVGFQIDEIDKLNIKTDSSLPLILESQKRKNKNFYFLPSSLTFKNNLVYAQAREIYFKDNKPLEEFSIMRRPDLANTFKEIPNDKILVETDSPYLAPVPLRGKPNEPSYIIHTVKFLSKLKNISFEDFSKITTKNFFNLFGKLN